MSAIRSKVGVAIAVIALSLPAANSAGAASAERPAPKQATVCSKVGKSDKLTCKRWSLKKLSTFIGIPVNQLENEPGGCWVQVGMGPHGYQWKAPCPL